jgi:hypothetical protein
VYPDFMFGNPLNPERGTQRGPLILESCNTTSGFLWLAGMPQQSRHTNLSLVDGDIISCWDTLKRLRV